MNAIFMGNLEFLFQQIYEVLVQAAMNKQIYTQNQDGAHLNMYIVAQTTTDENTHFCKYLKNRSVNYKYTH